MIFFDVSWCIVYYVLIYANIAKFCPQDEASLSDDDESGVDWMLEDYFWH